MKPTLILLALAIGIAAQVQPRTTYFGDRSKGEFYPVACGVDTSISSENWIVFDSREDAERKGYQFTPCPVDPRTAKYKKVKGLGKVPVGTAEPLAVVTITSEPSKWAGKLLMVRGANLKVTDVWKFDDSTYAFRISDGSVGFDLYMAKRSAAPLRELLLKNPGTDGVVGDFTLYLDPAGYQKGSDIYGRLVSYNIRK